MLANQTAIEIQILFLYSGSERLRFGQEGQGISIADECFQLRANLHRRVTDGCSYEHKGAREWTDGLRFLKWHSDRGGSWSTRSHANWACPATPCGAISTRFAKRAS